jgi:GNAT superfamily N-acetyltransferase
MSIQIRVLEPGDDRSRFSSGNPDLDRFFHRFAGQNQFRQHIGVTYVAMDDGDILGFLTVAASEIAIDALPAEHRRRLPRYPLPVLRVARLAVSVSGRGRGVGRALLRHALRLARRTAKEIGCVGLVVDAKPEALGFYLRYGFEALSVVEGTLLDRPEPTPMFLPLSAIPPAADR